MHSKTKTPPVFGGAFSCILGLFAPYSVKYGAFGLYVAGYAFCDRFVAYGRDFVHEQQATVCRAPIGLAIPGQRDCVIAPDDLPAFDLAKAMQRNAVLKIECQFGWDRLAAWALRSTQQKHLCGSA